MRDRPVVLIVEDETLIRLAAVEMLQEAGFATLEAPSADEAIWLLEQRTEIHVVFTDIEMPGSMDGLKLAAAIRRRWPPVHLIVTSGRVRIGERDLPSGVPFFSKPYDEAAVTSRIRELTTS